MIIKNNPIISLSLNLPTLCVAFSACANEPATLKEVFKNDFLIGAALNPSHFTEANAAEADIVQRQFNSITPENVMKWTPIHPRPKEYNFDMADQFVAFGEKNDMFIVGHTLVWHSQTPLWVFLGDGTNRVNREMLLQRMRDHILTVIGRYKGRVKGWDVVNEALNEDGTLRDSPWRRIIGDDYIEKAFQCAHEADPEAELYYNDYGIEDEPKRNGAIALVKRLQAAGVRIDGVGIQEHVNLTWPTAELLDETLTAFGQLGIKTMVTELDVDVLPRSGDDGNADISRQYAGGVGMNPFSARLPEEIEQRLADRYAELFSVYLKHRDHLQRVTLWGVTDANSWLNNWPIRGRTSYPLLFDRKGQPKQCFEAVLQMASEQAAPAGASTP